jgi:hypothetical protein
MRATAGQLTRKKKGKRKKRKKKRELLCFLISIKHLLFWFYVSSTRGQKQGKKTGNIQRFGIDLSLVLQKVVSYD